MGICRHQSDARIDHRISSSLSSSYPCFCRVVIPVSSSSYPRSSRSIARCILVVLFVVVVLYPHRRHIGIVHLEDPRRRYVWCTSRTSRRCTPQRSHPFAYGTRQGRDRLQMGRIGGVFSLGLKPFANGSCMQMGGNIITSTVATGHKDVRD